MMTREQLEVAVKTACEIAKEIVQRGGIIPYTVLILKGKYATCSDMEWQDSVALQNFIKKEHADAVIILGEGWGAPDDKYPPSKHPQRTAVLMVLGILPTGERTGISTPFVKLGRTGVVFLKSTEVESFDVSYFNGTCKLGSRNN